MANNFKFVQSQAFTLNGSGATSGATSIVLTSMKQIDAATLLTMTNFGTIGFGTLEPNSGTQEEQISFTGITQNSDGTATLTGISSVLFVSPYTKTSGLLTSHPGGVKFVISNTAGFYNELTSVDDDETINGLYTFVQNPQKSGSTTPTIAAEYSTKAYVDAVVGGIAVTNQLLVTGTAGENLTAGYVVYKKTSDGNWYIAKANDTTTFQQLELGIAQSTVLAAASVNVLIRGLDSNQSGLVAGTSYYITNAGGLVSSTPGTNTVFAGYGQSATSMVVDFRSIDIPYHTEKLGLVGTSGTPGSGNKYVTQLDVSSKGVAGLIMRATTTASIPALSAIQIFSVPIAALYIKSQLQGGVIYKKNGNGWGIKTPGTSGQFLQSQGAGADPTYAQAIVYNNVTSSRAGDTASGSQTVAHGLSRTPKFLRITARKSIGANSSPSFSDGAYNGTNTTCVYINSITGEVANISTTNIIFIEDSTAGSANQVATVTVDATNINLTWTKTGSPSANNIYMMFEVQG